MKKIVSIVIAIVMVLSLFSGVAAFAAEDVESAVKCVSADRIMFVKDGGEKDIMRVGGLNYKYSDVGNIYAQAKEYEATGVKFTGWVGTVAEINQFGYSVNGGEIVWDDSFKTATGDDVINAAASAGSTAASRFVVTIPLTDGIVNIEVYVKTAKTIEVIWKANYVNVETQTYYIKSGMNVRINPDSNSTRLGTLEKGRAFELIRRIPKAEADGRYDYLEVIWDNWDLEKSVAYIADISTNYTDAPVDGAGNIGVSYLWIKSEMNVRSRDAGYPRIGGAPVGSRVAVLETIPAAEFGRDNYDYYKIVWPDAEGGVAYVANLGDTHYSTTPTTITYPVVTPYYVLVEKQSIYTSPSESNPLAGAYFNKGEILPVVEVIDKETTGEAYTFIKVYMENLVNGGYVYVALTDAVSAENPNGADPIIAVEGSTEEPEDKPSEGPVSVTSVDDFAKGPGEYKLANDITGIFHTPGEGGKYVIDLNGKTWTATADILLQVKDNAEVIVKNGTLVSKEGAQDTIDIIGNAKLTLVDVTVKGNVGSADAIFVNGGSTAVIVLDNCDLSAGKAGIDNTSNVADITVIGGKFSVYGEGAEGNGRSCAIELRNNAKIKLVGDINFEQNAIICRTATHTNSWADSFILSEGAKLEFSADVDLGSGSGNQYTQVKATYTAPVEPETGDFGLIALAFVAISSVVVKKRKEN